MHTTAGSKTQSKVVQGSIMLTRRHIIASTLAAPAILRLGTGSAKAATTLKVSHQFPGGTIDKGDFRDRLCRMFAAEVAKRSDGEITAEVYPNSSLIKTNAQFSAMRKGALDISLYPMPYAGGELPETNIGLMPGLVATYDQGLRWKKEPVGKALTDFLADKGIILLTWVWQAGGVASRSKAIVAPEDAIEVAKVYEKAGAKISKLDIATVGKWRDIARDTAWKDYGAKTATAANLLKLASDVSA